MASIETTRDEHDGLTVHTVAGEVSLDKIFECVRSYNQAGPTPNTLWDFRNGSIATPATDTMDPRTAEAAQLLASERSGKIALVVEGNLEFGVLRVWSAYTEAASEDLKLRLFHSYGNAIDWFKE
jgi:hypothetical protein